jgi:hypothetical protein
MSVLMRSIYAEAVLACLIGTALMDTASAQEINAVAPLTAGGLTIGGPGAVETQGGDSFFFWASTTPRDVCVTVVNFGNVGVTVQLSSSQFTPANVGRTISVCAPNTSNITGTCGNAAGALCRYLWRVDKAS